MLAKREENPVTLVGWGRERLFISSKENILKSDNPSIEAVLYNKYLSNSLDMGNWLSIYSTSMFYTVPNVYSPWWKYSSWLYKGPARTQFRFMFLQYRHKTEPASTHENQLHIPTYSPVDKLYIHLENFEYISCTCIWLVRVCRHW